MFEGNTNSLWFNQWLEQHLFEELSESSTSILDNARFHKKQDVEAIAALAGHQVLFLPPYSPDFNDIDIEQDFAIIKKKRAYAPSGTTIDQIVQAYGN